NDNVTHLLVRNFTGALNNDLDTNDDGVLDVVPWTAVVDAVALIDSANSGDKTYASVGIGPNGSSVPGHVFRRSDIDGAWQIGAFDPANGDDTPGASNGGTPPPSVPFVEIPAIQGLGHRSPYLGQRVKTSGIVTAVESNGFYLQDAVGDGDPATSDAVFVFTGSLPTMAVADSIEVEATVDEFIPGGAGSQNLSITELTGAQITLLASAQALPAAVVIGAQGLLPPTRNIDDDGLTVYQPDTDAIDFYEALEAMRVTVKNARAVAPLNRFNEIFVVAENGLYADGINSRGGITIQADDYNPERIQIQIDADFLPGFAEVVDTGDALGDVHGVVGYSFGNFEVKATEAFAVAAAGLEKEISALAPTPSALTVASFNVLNLDPNDRDGDTDIADGRFDRLGAIVAQSLNAPDIVALEEIQDNSGSWNDGVTDASLTYETLIDAIAAAGGPVYAFADIAPDNNADGGQPGGNIRVGFLYNPERVAFQAGSLQRLSGDAFAGARKPLVADFVFNGETVTVIGNHFSSKGGSTPIFGRIQPFINGGEDKRIAQAVVVRDFVAGLLQDNPEANVVVLGDFNEFQFNAPLSTLKGEQTALLTDLIETLPLLERYSYNFEGNAQALDHILVSPALAGRSEFDAVHVNAEFADQASDHDPLLASVQFGQAKHSVRFATFNASLNRPLAGLLIEDLSTANDKQAQAVAEIIQRNAPDVLLLNEFDYDAKGLAVRLFQRNYLSVGQNGAEPIAYRHVYLAASNTGIDSGLDLNRDGSVGGPDDAYGFGFFPGQYGMVLLSKFPIDRNRVRTFQHFLWKDMPGALLPDDPATEQAGDWYSAPALSRVRLSSKSHWDVPLLIRGNVVHALLSHPTPPVFDGPEDRNGRRNHDEIRFWADYVAPGQSEYIYDDNGGFGGLKAGEHFVVMGDMNADPNDGDSTGDAIGQLLNHPAVNTAITPVSRGAVEAAFVQGGANGSQRSAPDFDTADFADTTPGNLRTDYVLPSKALSVEAAGVYWPLSSEPGFSLVGHFPFPSSDHRLVWADVGNLLGRIDPQSL
ncbi:MAG: endonuclease/exonuclease/phosphatase family protein, partial [Gammaproteobacteria bacterium]